MIDSTRSLFLPQQWEASEADRQAYIETLQSLGHLAPRPLYDMLWSIRRAEIQRNPELLDRVTTSIREGISAFPAVASRGDLDAVIKTNSELVLGRAVDWVYLTACKSVPGLVQDLITIESPEEFAEGETGKPTIIAPFHLGPNEVLLGTVANRVSPLTVVISARELLPNTARRMKRLSTSGNIETISTADLAVLLRCRDALRRGRIVAIYPEIFRTRDHKLTAAISFLGRKIYVPLGLQRLAKVVDADVIPCYVRRDPGGRYRCVIGPRMKPTDDLPDRLFGYCESLIKDDMAAEWECWTYARELLLSKPPSPDETPAPAQSKVVD